MLLSELRLRNTPQRHSGAPVTDIEILRWIHEQLKAEMPVGPYSVSTDYEKQVQEWRCTGCTGSGESKWPEWRLVFAHENGCRWVAFMNRVDGFDGDNGE